MTAMELISREKRLKRESATRKEAQIVAEEIISRRRRFFQAMFKDPDLLKWIGPVETILKERP